ncbi:nSTAND1 domain-containing NTPase [Actinomadura napierensis]|uniref:Novel STAND NTPase 1 domain-containing protein n=1 Tax=Actinomadura napierensis TaxID=267854 RepID=A0ABN2YN29_9ACTN
MTPGPFVGPRPFEEGDHGTFFGRWREVHDLADLWKTCRVTVLHGASGVGKTSLLHAGLFPRLAADRNGIVTLRQGETPEQLALRAQEASSALPPREPSRAGPGVLLALDRPPRVYREDGLHERGFAAGLATALAPLTDVHLVVSVRTDRLAEAVELGRALGVEPELFSLGPLSRASALDAVTKPPSLFGVDFEPGVAGRLVDDLAAGEQTVAPLLLQVVCKLLWDALPKGERTIRAELLPDVELALSVHCVEVLDEITAAHGLPTCEIGSWLRDSFLAPDDRTVAIPCASPSVRFDGSVMRTIENRQLLKVVLHEDVPHYELQHRRLADALRRLGEGDPGVDDGEPAERLRAARAALADGEPRVARRNAEVAAKQAKGPDKTRIRAEAQFLLGDVFSAEGDWQEAVHRYQGSQNLYGLARDFRAIGLGLAAEGRARLAQGDTTGAVEVFRAALNRLPGESEVFIGLARALLGKGQWPVALTVLEAVPPQQVAVPEVHRIRGEILADVGDAEEALRTLNRLPGRALPPVRAARALALARLGRSADARAELDGLGPLVSGADGPALFRLARAHRILGEIQAAVGFAERAHDATGPAMLPHQRDMGMFGPSLSGGGGE